jgi:hypothetical protein
MTNTELLTGDRTRAESVVSPALARPTRTSQDELAEQAGFLHSVTRVLTDGVAGLHRRTIEVQLRSRTEEAAKRSAPDLLNELADLGIAWRDIARMVGVTVPAVRKWRQGEPATGAHRKATAGLLAFIDVLRSEHHVVDVPSWLEMPLGDSSVTGVDVYAGGLVEPLVMHAAGHISAEQLLDQFDPDWHRTTERQFEIFTAADGQAAIRMRTAEMLE